MVFHFAELVPGDFLLDRWVWLDPSTDATFLIPLVDRILDTKRSEAQQLARDQDRASRLYPPRWQDVILRFASKVLNPASMSPGVRGHYERLLHERHWMVCHNACKGAKTDAVRKTLLTCQLCVSNSTSAEDTSDHLFRSCQHPLLCQARSQSGSILLTSLLLTDLDQRLFPVLLRLFKRRMDTNSA